MNQRFFRAQPEVYEAMRSQLDAAFGHPRTGTETAFQPVSMAPKDASGLAYLGVWDFFCEWPQVASLLQAAMDAGVVAEIDEATFRSAAPSPAE
jgi:hypothetical protein